jgi:PAS domain S-box-containing protein
MNDHRPAHPAQPPYRAVLRAIALALLCGLLQALLPRYTLGASTLAPLSVVLGVAVAAAMSRGRWTVPAALAGVLAGDWLTGSAGPAALLGAGVLGLQAMTAGWLMRHAPDPDLLQLDTAARLRRFVLVAAPAAAAVGVLAAMLAQWGLDAAAALPLARPQLAAAVGRFIADSAGVVVTAPVLLCWLAQPQAPWRPRRRAVALPLVLLVLVMLPGFHQVARRDEQRLQSAFERDATARRLRITQLLADPVEAAMALRGVIAAGGAGLPPGLFNALASGWTERVPGLRSVAWLAQMPAAGAPIGAAVSASAAAPGAAPVWQLRHLHAAQNTPSSLPGVQLSPEAGVLMAPALRRAADKALASDGPVALTALAAATAPAMPGNSGPPSPTAAPGNTAGVRTTANPALLLLLSVPADAAGAARKQLVIAVVDANPLLASALPGNDDPNLRVCLTSSADNPAQPAIARHRLAGPPGCENDAPGTAVRSQISRVNVGEQRLDLLISEPPTADNRLFTAVWLLALPAVVGAAMLSALLLALTGRLRRIEDRVQERTLALRAEIDERRQAETALAVSEQRFRAIFEGVNIGVTVVDPAGRIVEVNPAFCQMMGCSAADLLQRPLADFQLPDVTGDDGTAVAMGGAQARRQRYLTPDGRVLQVAASLRTLFDASGQPVATVGALQDLTQVLRLREAEREQEHAQTASRSKSEFLANLSHELRAPLNAILGFAQMLGRGDTGDDDSDLPRQAQRHGLAQIRQAGWHLLDMINDVLDLSRMEAGSLRLTLEPVSLADLVQEAVAMVEPAALQAGVVIELSLSPQADRVQADALRLRQVLINLLGNAIQYNRPGGLVVLRTRPGAVGELQIEVEDNGIGLSQAQIAELFTPFNRLGRTQQAAGAPGSQGTGIGLVICRKLCDLMGGELSVSSHEGQGSVFGLRLPRPLGEPSRSIISQHAPLVPGVSIGSVLYIEDDEADIAAMRQLLLQRPGITLVCVRSAAEGLVLAGDADLVLLDLDLPDRPGIELLRALRADTRLRSTPVIVVSAESRPQRIDDCFNAGATQFLSKPLAPQQTLRAIDESLA